MISKMQLVMMVFGQIREYTKAVGKSVSENLAYNYATAQEALTAWLNSPTHKVTIEGDFTHFGIAAV
jgi:uncharacterized protein YkwD